MQDLTPYVHFKHELPSRGKTQAGEAEVSLV
jgi:hypothetical protein